MLAQLEKEASLYSSWITETKRQLVQTMDEGTLEIIEDYDEDKEKAWREKHRENVRKYRQKLAKEKIENLENKNNSSKAAAEEDQEAFWSRLDELELEEDLMEAQMSLEDIKLTTLTKLSKKSSENQSNSTTVDTKRRVSRIANSVKLQDLNREHSDQDVVVPRNKRIVINTDNNQVHKIKKDNFSDKDRAFDPIMIKFAHSSVLGKSSVTSGNGSQDLSNMTPAQLVDSIIISKTEKVPKSILKASKNPASMTDLNFNNSCKMNVQHERKTTRTMIGEETLAHKVVEKKVIVPEPSFDNANHELTRPISLFKMKKMMGNR